MDYGYGRTGKMSSFYQILMRQRSTSEEHQRTLLNTETLVVDLGWKERRLTKAEGVAERRRVFWSVQVDAAAGGEVKDKAGRRRLSLKHWGGTRKTMRRRGTKGKKENGPRPYL